MFIFDYIIKENTKEHNINWPQNRDHPYRILITGGSGSGKTNAILNFITRKLYTDQIYFILWIHMKQNPGFWLTNAEVLA